MNNAVHCEATVACGGRLICFYNNGFSQWVYSSLSLSVAESVIHLQICTLQTIFAFAD